MTTDSKSVVRKDVGVRPSPGAPFEELLLRLINFRNGF